MSTSNSELGIKEEPPSTPSTKDLKRDYQIVISQDGKFVATFDTVNLRIKVLENTDYRPSKFEDDEDPPRESENEEDSPRESENDEVPSESEKINKTIVHFKIYNDFKINEFYRIKNDDVSDSSSSSNNKVTTEVKDKFRWSIDISNLRERDHRYFILVAVSRINVEEDMKETKEDMKETKEDKKETKEDKKDLSKMKYTFHDLKDFENKDTTIDIFETKGTAIYCLKLEKESEKFGKEFGKESERQVKVTYAFKENTVKVCRDVSGICKFIDVTDKSENNDEQERFIILNFYGIYDFEYNYSKDISINWNKKFDYLKSIRSELYGWNIMNGDCTERLRSYIYNKYFIATQEKNQVQSIEVYNLAKMKLETVTERIKNKVKRSDHHAFSVSRLQLCFTRVNSILLYYIENGLQVASKKFNETEEIYSLEFIDSDEKLFIIGRNKENNLVFLTWDLYNTGEVTQATIDYTCTENLHTHLARTSGNILHVDNKGNVISVLKKIENELKESNEKKSKLDGCAELVKNNSDDKHKIYYDKNDKNTKPPDNITISNFKKIADWIEPWMTDYYIKNSYCLYYGKEGTKTEVLQLIVGRSTVQIWHQISDDDEMNDQLANKGDSFLEYIWTNGIPVDQERNETRLQIEDFKYESNDGSNHKLKNFSLKVYWYVSKSIKKAGETNKDRHSREMEESVTNKTAKYVEKRTMVIKQKDIIKTFHPMRHACEALKHFNERRKNIKCRQYKYEEIVTYIENIVWRLAKHNPEQFKLLDVRYDFMKSLILGDCNHLIEFILFGSEGNVDDEKEKKERKKRYMHIPRNRSWSGKDYYCRNLNGLFWLYEFLYDEKINPKNDMELAIYHCRDRELKDTTIVAYLLEYYSEHAKDCAGWMCTVSNALPLLFKYHYDDYIRKLFRKEVFVSHHHFLTQHLGEIATTKHLGRLNGIIKFRVTKQPIDKLCDSGDRSRFWHCRIFEKFGKDNNKSHKSPLASRVVPLPGFTINGMPKLRIENNFILNIFLLIFIPRWYKIRRNNKDRLSPLSRMVLYENNEDIYDNPAIVAAIDFRWQKAKHSLSLNFIRILIFAVCFVIVSREYLVHEVIIKYHGFKKYLDLFNFFDICSIALPVTVMSIIIKEFQFSNGFGNIETVDTGLVVGISFSIFFLWIELIFFLRLISRIGIYLYYSVVIFKTILPFFFFMLITIIAFAHSMFTLLRDPVNISTKDQTLSGNAINTLTNQTLDIKLKSDFDPTSRVDNPFSSFVDAIEAAYFWINGNWIQRDEFDFLPVEVYSVIASIVLVIFIQNLLIAYMGGMHEKADTKGRQILLRHRARYIANFEALYHIHLWHDEPEPKQIYYFGYLKDFEKWLKDIKDDQGAIVEKSTCTNCSFKDYYRKEFFLKYDCNVDTEVDTKNKKIEKIEQIKNMKNDINDNIQDLVKNFTKNKHNKIEYINNITNNMNSNIKYLIDEFER